jgi:hypothetical protein
MLAAFLLNAIEIGGRSIQAEAVRIINRAQWFLMSLPIL